MKLPTMYSSRWFLKVSMIPEVSGAISLFSIKAPVCREVITMTGIIGGILMFDPAKVSSLFSLKSAARKNAAPVWNPQMGIIPRKTPRAREADFTSALS